jgi:hypothetical protein
MTGFIFRMAVAVKEFGERRHSGFFVRLGLAVREWVSKYPVH